MVSPFKDRLALYKAKKDLKEQERSYQKYLKNAKKEGKDREEIRGIHSEAQGVFQEYQHEVDILDSRQLVKRARKLHLPVPDYDDKEKWESDHGYHFLSESGRIHLVNIIRKEKRAWLDRVFSFSTAIAAVVLAFITYFQIDEARQMRRETNRMVNLSIEQFKIKSYPSILLSPYNLEITDNMITIQAKLMNKGEITAFQTSVAAIYVFSSNTTQYQFAVVENLSHINEGGEKLRTLESTFDLYKDTHVPVDVPIVLKEDQTIRGLKYLIYIIRFKVPYDLQYRYKTFTFLFDSKPGNDSSQNTYRILPLLFDNRDRLVELFKKSALMRYSSEDVKAVDERLKRFLVDFDKQ